MGEGDSSMNETPQKQPHQYLLYEVTKKCQNQCVFCYNVWKEDDQYPQRELSTPESLALIDKVIEETGCKYIGLTGGEPLLRKDIFEMAARISAKGVVPILISNGALLTKDTVRKLIESGVTDFEVSIHSHEREIHDELVGRDGSYDEALDAILNVKELGGNVSAVFVATKRNIGGLKAYVEFCALLRVTWVLFNRVACGGTCVADFAALAPSPSELRAALDEAAPLADKYKIGFGAGVQIQPCLLDLSRYANVRTSFCPLNNIAGGRTYFAIDPSGNLRMCNRSRILLGNLRERRFEDIAHGREVREFGRAVPEFCLDCDLAHVCAGGCKADALACHGTLTKPDPYLEMWKGEVRKKSVEVRKA
jgi:radical SAM protein with 4Fe4S-binding SPASM domain